MKTCPTCHTQYTDDSLRFCLQDGSSLSALPGSETIINGGAVTSGENLRSVSYEEQGDEESEITRVSKFQPTQKKRNTAVVVILTALLTVVIVAAVGILFYSRSGESEVTKKMNTAANNSLVANPGNSLTPTVSPTRSSESNASNNSAGKPTPAVPDNVDRERLRQEVEETIGEWESASESGDIISLMENYAGTVDYYNNRGTSVGSVRRDKQRAFALYDSIDFDISNVSITNDSSGNTATAVFDKEWDFEGPKNSAGKVRSQLQLRRQNGKWVITGERDLKVYYIE